MATNLLCITMYIYHVTFSSAKYNKIYNKYKHHAVLIMWFTVI